MIGIFGGTFDPIHYGHLRSAIEVSELFHLRQVHLIPCAQPAHRAEPLSSAQQRADMVRLAVTDAPRLVCDTRELNRQGASYTLDTLKSLRTELADETLLLFVGADAFAGLSRWYCWRELFDYAHIVVLTRPDNAEPHIAGAEQAFLQARLTTHKIDLQTQTTGLLYFQRVTALAISASHIRHLIAQGHSPRFLLPDAVLSYIYQHQLYLV
jgi:nicotinate-nucleotide adenylyltransferase